MRALLRGRGAICALAVRGFTVLAGVAYVSLLINISRGGFTSSVLGVAFVLLVVLAGILWCLNQIALTPAAPVAPGSPLVRNALRLLAAVQIGLGLSLAVMYGLDAYPHIRIGTRHQTDHALLTLALLPGALGLACVGGVLWCVVRVAYPPETVSTAPHTATPPAGTSDIETRSAP